MRLLAGLAVLLFAAGAMAQDVSSGGAPQPCKEAREGLPTQDPIFGLTGKITMRNGTVYDVVQFGKAGIYSNYTMGLRGPGRCLFHFYQIKKIEVDDYANRWRMTLLNGYSPPDTGGMYYLDGNAAHALVASPVDGDKTSWLNVVAKEPRFAQPREISLSPREISAIEIYNPQAGSLGGTASVPAGGTEAPTPKAANGQGFVIPAVVSPYPPPNTRTGTLLLFKADAEGNLSLSQMADLGESGGRVKFRLEPGKQELIWISDDGRQAAPLWFEVVSFKRDNKGFDGDGRFQCMKSLGKWHDPEGGRQKQGRELSSYNPCVSLLTITDNTGTATAANAIATIGTFGLAALGGGGHQEKRLDREKLLALLEKSAQEIREGQARLAERR